MNHKDLPNFLTREDFLHELHHLLWIKPLVNNGIKDDGWNCRDHAYIVAGIAQVLGFKASIIYGKAAFIHGSYGAIAGMGRDLKMHSWAAVDGAGFYDLSVRLSWIEDFPEWKDWETAGLAGNGFLPSGRVVFKMTLNEYDFQNAMNAATHLEGVNSAIYWGGSFSELTASDIENAPKKCNSPLTDKLRATFGERQDLYAKAILHLVEYLQGKIESVVKLPQMEAWEKIASRPGDAVYRVCSRGKLQ